MYENCTYFKYEYHPSDVLVVCFSHVNYPEGKFAFANAIAHMECKKIFVNCRDNSWYQQGIPGLGETIEDSALSLKKIISDICPKKTIFVGMSMGGYGAILFGLMTQADIILSFTSELMLGGSRTRSFKENRCRVYHPVFSNLAPLIYKNNRTLMFMIYGEEDLVDLSLLWPISQKIIDKKQLHFFLSMGGHQCTLNLNLPLMLKVLIKDGWLSEGLIDPDRIRKYTYLIEEFYLYNVIENALSNLNYHLVLDVLSKNSEITESRHFLKKIRDDINFNPS